MSKNVFDHINEMEEEDLAELRRRKREAGFNRWLHGEACEEKALLKYAADITEEDSCED